MALSQEHINDLLNRKRRPNGPGSVLLDIIEDEDEDNDYTIESFAEQMGVSTEYLTSILEGITPINEDIANKIGTVLGNGSELWLNLQESVDIWDKHYETHSSINEIVNVITYEEPVSVNGEFKTWSVT